MKRLNYMWPSRIKSTFITRLEQERRAFLHGKQPAPFQEHNAKRGVAKALVVFFAAMLMFTLLSRAMDGLMVARVRVDVIKSGIITIRTRLDGVIENSEFEAQTDKETAAKLSVGDAGLLSYTYEGFSSEVPAVITHIEGEYVTVSLPQDIHQVTATGTFIITGKSNRQNAVLPISALRSDYLGDFVLVVAEKRTVTGVEHTVYRISVTVEIKDTAQMSVTGRLNSYDRVIISSNKPISEGDRVRLD